MKTNRLLLPAVIALQSTLSAQAPVRYRYVTTTPGTFAAGADQVTRAFKSGYVYNNRATSLLAVTSRDSAGGVIWQLAVDTSVIDFVILDSALATHIPPSSIKSNRPKVPSIYQAFVLGGKPVSTTCCAASGSKPSPVDSLNPTASLLQRWPGLSLLIPNQSLPAKVGQTHVDTIAKHTVGTYRADTVRTNPATGQTTTMQGTQASDTYDTTIVRWKRSTRDTLDATVTRVIVTIIAKADDMTGPPGISLPRPSTRADGTGSYRIVYDGQQGIREARYSITTTTRPLVPGSLPTLPPSTLEYLLVRVP